MLRSNPIDSWHIDEAFRSIPKIRYPFICLFVCLLYCTVLFCTYDVVLLEFDLDIRIGLPEEIRVFQVGGLDEFDSESHGDILF